MVLNVNKTESHPQEKKPVHSTILHIIYSRIKGTYNKTNFYHRSPENNCIFTKNILFVTWIFRELGL